jgi:hypothetical protein
MSRCVGGQEGTVLAGMEVQAVRVRGARQKHLDRMLREESLKIPIKGRLEYNKFLETALAKKH